VLELLALGIFIALLWIGWELRRIAHYAAECSDELDSIKTAITDSITDVERKVSEAGTEIAKAVDAVKQEIFEVGEKLDTSN
jgi:hypothetical protein